ncbi:unnamed protein product [Toxocara canis]|uniref:Uncharacterized protein n=1 Tax=Toxocara canis TaxID=6265 RepID=A0A183URA0_TOXCA|nr:unnamed protein product [Toxocara canis]
MRNVAPKAEYDDDFKRPSSPIEKIKSLFRKSKEPVAPAPVSSQPKGSTLGQYDYLHYSPIAPSAASTRFCTVDSLLSHSASTFIVLRINLTDKVFGAYPSSNISPVAPRDPYTPQYRKHTDRRKYAIGGRVDEDTLSTLSGKEGVSKMITCRRRLYPEYLGEVVISGWTMQVKHFV